MLPPHAPDLEAVPTILRRDGRCAQLAAVKVFDDETHWPEAKAFCGRCPVASQCLAYALGNEKYGLWGGLTPEERDEVRGSVLVFGPEDRRRAAKLRAELASGKSQEQIARDYGCDPRTVLRWAAADRQAA